jgi:hypothetical protein
MKGKALVAGIAGVAAGLMVASSVSAAEPFDSKLQAAVYNTKLVQAQDECASPTTIIGGVDACAPANATTASGETFSVGKLLVKSTAGSSQVLAILKSSSNGENKKNLAGKTLRVRLTLRVTKRSSAALPVEPVTWVDQVLNCAASVVPSNGNFLFKGQLGGVLGCGLDLDLANNAYEKEIVSASIIDAGSGLAIAVPGVRKK